MNDENKVWQLPIDVEASGVVTKTLATADTYLDKNIKVTVNTPDAAFEVKKAAAVTATVSTSDTTYTTETETAYPIVIAADATAGAVQVGVKTAGFAAASDVVEVGAANATQNTKTIYVKAGHLTGSGEATATSDTIKMTKGGEGDFKFTAVASGGAKVDVAGWLSETAAADSSGNATYAVQAASLANTETAGTTYVDHTGPVLTSGGYLYINEGYIKDTKISLADLVPDNANITSENANLVYNTVKAYDKDGALIVGTMGNAALSPITASNVQANIGNVSVAAQDGVFHVTGTGAISGDSEVHVATRGLAETTLSQTGTISGEASLDATLAKIGLAIDTPAAITVKPVIAKDSGSTAKSGAITTTAPSGHYVAVSTDAIAASVNVSPKVATAGYGTVNVFDATGATVTGGAEASGMFYVPINAGSHTAVASAPSITNASATVATSVETTSGFEGSLVAGVLEVVPESGEYITISGNATPVKGSVSGTVTCTSTEGYIESSSQTASISGNVEVEVTAAAPKYIRVYDGSIL